MQSKKDPKKSTFKKKGIISNKWKFSLSEKGTKWTTKSRTKVLTIYIIFHVYIYIAKWARYEVRLLQVNRR